MSKKPKILILVGGNIIKLDPFVAAAESMSVDLFVASFSDISYDNLVTSDGYSLNVRGEPLNTFELIYFRLVGNRVEEATLVANEAKKYKIPVVDALYSDSLLLPSSLAKSVEMAKLIDYKLPLPRTIYGNLASIIEKSRETFGIQFVIKSTTGKKSREVWSAQTEEQLNTLVDTLSQLEVKGMRFFTQEFIPGSQRIRVLVVGDEAVAAITRPTKWRKRFLPKNEAGNVIEGEKRALIPVPTEDAELAITSARAVGLNIAGVDILHDDTTNKAYILEVNAAPSWKAITKDTGMNIEKKILEYLISLL